MRQALLVCLFCFCFINQVAAQASNNRLKVLAFYTARHDQAHISFVKEANPWFAQMAAEHGFTYHSTTDWTQLNAKVLAQYQVILFLDSRPEAPEQRKAFEHYMKNGGAWMGFHFAGFALTPSTYEQNWDWYHNQFVGAGEYKSNTWRPTSAILKVEDSTHTITKGLPTTFTAAPNEWYSWKNDLRANAQIKILLSIDPQSFPLGTGPKSHEIWHSGDYPVAWTNTNYKMVYLNMGHNDIDYENKTNKTLSSTFSSQAQNQFILNAVLWLGQPSGKENSVQNSRKKQ